MPLTLNRQATERDYHNARYFATACDLAYLPEAAGKPKFLSELSLDARLVSVDNTQVYVGGNDDSIVIAFRGSEAPGSLDGFKDWLLTNAKNFLVLPEGRAGTDFVAAGVGARFHRGFIEALEEIWTPFFSEVKALHTKKKRPVWVTGHSLGGALALLSAWRLQRQFIPIHQVYTFGAPMIGNDAAKQAYAKVFPNKVFRFIDERDMVPLLPTVSLLSNEYQHCMAEVLLKAASADAASAGIVQDLAKKTQDGILSATLADELWGRMRSGVECHLMGNYLARISEHC
jgi:triacylglycerol lipase